MNPDKPADKMNMRACIEWTGLLQPNGYGRLYINDTFAGVHRLSWALANGRMPKRGMDICHRCDNRKYINPDHLFEGTRKDNMRDAANKGRTFSHNKLKPFCKRGHPFDEGNTRISFDGRRVCKECHRMHNRNWRAK